MAVSVIDQNFGINGHAQSIKDFRRAHNENTIGILNAAEKLPVDAERPAYDPNHEDNQWPLMLHHAEKGQAPVGENILGVTDPDQRKAIAKRNDNALKTALGAGWRKEPYTKPQVAVMDPASEKKALQDTIGEQNGKIVALTDLVQKLLSAQNKA